MSYEVLARRWRPDTWASIVGQPHVTKLLATAIDSDRVAHAFLFTGIRGVGKTTAARVLARALNCRNRKKGAEPCNSCATCEQILSGASVDVIEIDGASNRGIDEVRDIIDSAAYRPAASDYKIYIIDEVHQLTGPAFNALLKILEEPPAHVKFVMATTEWQKVPATILSRCQRYDFRRIATDTIAEHLDHICKSDDIIMPKEALAFIAREADGSMRDAQSLLEQVAAVGGKSVKAAEVAELLGMPDHALVAQMVTAILESRPDRVVETVAALRGFAFDSERFLGEVLELLRHTSVVGAAGEKRLSETVGGVFRETAVKLGKSRSALDLHRIFNSLLATLSDLRRGGQPELVLEMGLLKAACLDSVASVGEVLARLEQAAATAGSGGGGGSAGGVDRGNAGPRVAAPSSGRGSQSHAGAAGRSREAATSGVEEAPMPGDEDARVGASSGGSGPLRSGGGESSTDVPSANDRLAGSDADRWEAFLTAAQRSAGIELYVALSNCEVLSIGDHGLRIHPTLSTFRDKIAQPETAARLQAAVTEFFGADAKLEVLHDKPLEEGPGMTLSAIDAERDAKIREDAANDPLVREAIDRLGGRIEKITRLED